MKTIILTLFITFLTFSVNAQELYNERFISNKNVFSHSMLGDILWLGADGGIVKFNKHTEEFINYNYFNDTSIHGYYYNLSINHLVVNAAGELYASGEVLIHYNGTDWYRYTNLPSYLSGIVAIDNENRLWTSSGEYMCRLESDTFHNIRIPFPPGSSNIEINECTFDSENSAWIGTSSGLFKIENDQVEGIEEFQFERINTLKVKDDSILIGTKSNGLRVYYPDEGKIVDYDKTNSGIKSNRVEYIHQDGDSFWLIAGGLYQFKNGTFKEFMDKDSVLNRLILNRVLPDGDILWLSTANDGLYKYDLNSNSCDKKIISNLQLKNKVRTFCVDTLGTTYFMVPYKQGAVRITGAEGSSVKTIEDMDYFNQNFNPVYISDTFKIFEKNQVFINFYQEDRTVVTYEDDFPHIDTITEDLIAISGNNPQLGDLLKTGQDNTIYHVSQDGGYWRYNDNWTQFTRNNSAIPTESLSNLCFDHSGKLWFSSNPGLNTSTREIIPGALMSFNGTEHQALSIADIPGVSDSSAFISCIYIDSSNALWLGISDLWANGVSHGYGLFRYDGNSWTNYTIDNSGLSGNTINSINAYGSELYIGTSGGGISIFDPAAGTWKTYTTDNSLLPWNTVNSIDFDSSDSMYIYHYWNDVLKTGMDIEASQRNLAIDSFEDEVIVYPNPTNDILTIKTTAEFPILIKKISIYSLSGKLLAIKNVSANHNNMTSISLKDFSIKDGMYIIEITTDQKAYIRNIVLYN